jgi:hypothetical protein
MQMIKKQGQKDQDFLSEDGVTYRKPKQLFSKEFEEMARQKTALIEEKKLDREKKFQRPIPQTSSSKWNAEETGKKESSVDQSSDSIKVRIASF